jgi:hypothetical protein
VVPRAVARRPGADRIVGKGNVDVHALGPHHKHELVLVCVARGLNNGPRAGIVAPRAARRELHPRRQRARAVAGGQHVAAGRVELEEGAARDLQGCARNTEAVGDEGQAIGREAHEREVRREGVEARVTRHV